MLPQELTFSRALNPALSNNPKWPHFAKPLNPLPKSPIHYPRPFKLVSQQNPNSVPFCRQNPSFPRQLLSLPPAAGRSKKPSTSKVEGSAELRRDAKRNAKRKSQKLAESLFYRLKNPHKNHADNFSEEELQMIGLGYDRMVRFMSKDDPNLKHPYDWYKYGEFGPYSWRGIVLGDPIRGRMSDECATIIGSVRDHEEWEKIEQHEMAVNFGNRMGELNKDVGFQSFWIFVRHPKWRLSDLPWQQWTLVCEVVLEAGNQRLDKWNLMGRLGNKTRALITQCAAWMRPDIIYVKKPVYQCRFEPQVEFFKALLPLLDPQTENDFFFEVEDDQGRVELCTYFGGLCKILRVSPKAFVDDVVKAYEKLSDEKKSKCLEFLLANHPVPLLHPYTKEWKTKLEEIDMGCDAPDDDDDDSRFHNHTDGKEFTEWDEADNEKDDDYDDNSEDDYDIDDDVVMNTNVEDDELGLLEEEEDLGPEEDEQYWKDEFEKAVRSNDAMENLVKRSVERSSRFYEKQLKDMEEKEIAGIEDDGDETALRGKRAKVNLVKRSVERSSQLYEKQLKDMEEKEIAGIEDDGDETALRGKRAKVSPEEWKTIGLGPWMKRIKKSKIPPELFLRAAVRPFTYRNLVKEIVLTRHAILDGEIKQQ